MIVLCNIFYEQVQSPTVDHTLALVPVQYILMTCLVRDQRNYSLTVVTNISELCRPTAKLTWKMLVLAAPLVKQCVGMLINFGYVRTCVQ